MLLVLQVVYSCEDYIYEEKKEENIKLRELEVHSICIRKGISIFFPSKHY